MRRIFYLITELDIGGAEKALYELVRRLDRRRFDATVGCLTGRGPIGEWLEREGVPVRYFDIRGWWDVAGWLRLRQAVRDCRPHVIHGFLFHANMAARLAAAGLKGTRVICAVRVEEPRRRHLWMDRATRSLVDHVTCVSESARRYTHRHAGYPLAKLETIPNGIDPSQWAVSVLNAPETWNIPPDAPVVGIVGRLDRQKGPSVALRTARRVVERVPNVVFAFAGDGPLADCCRREAESLRITANVRWLGWLKDVRPLYARMTVLLLASRWEGMPNVVLEAMSARKPVVATRTGGSAELIVDGETGFLVPIGDVETLAQRIETILRTPNLATEMGNAGHDRVVREFSLDTMVRRNVALYQGGYVS